MDGIATGPFAGSPDTKRNTLGALWIVGGMAVIAVRDNFVSAVALVWAVGRLETLRARAR